MEFYPSALLLSLLELQLRIFTQSKQVLVLEEIRTADGVWVFFGEKSTSVAGVSFEKYKQEAESV